MQSKLRNAVYSSRYQQLTPSAKIKWGGFVLLAVFVLGWVHLGIPIKTLSTTTTPLERRRAAAPKTQSKRPLSPTSSNPQAIPGLKKLLFNCHMPKAMRLRSGCALKATSGQVPKLKPGGHLPGGRSQNREDLNVLQRYFFNRKGGTFLEMGALNGLKYSNSYYFERYLGWTGLLIEGSPTLYKQLKVNRPDAITLNAMVCGEEQQLHWIDNTVSKDASQATGGAYELMPKQFSSYHHKHITKEMLDKLPTVPCMRLDRILANYGIKHVDFWSLDVEGAELSVLETVDFSKFSASVIVIEFRPGSGGVHAYMNKHGYIRSKRIGNNDVYLHPDFAKTIKG